MINDRLVYSTDAGRICPDCQKAAANCICKELAAKALLGDGNVKIRREVKGRGGKTVITVTGLPLDKDRLKELLAELKRSCGAGGTVKDGVLELQGEHLDRVRSFLQIKGYKPKG